MQKIKTPVGIIIVDDYSKIITEDDFNKLSEDQKLAYTYYITNSDSTYLLKICKEGNIIINSAPIILSSDEPENGTEGVTWIEETSSESSSDGSVIVSETEPDVATKGTVWIQQIKSYNNNEGLIVSDVQPTTRAGQIWIDTSK